MNAKRTSDGNIETTPEKAMEDLVRASAEAMEMALKGDWAKEVETAAPPLHPLMAHPTAMMAAATVVGMGVSSQLTGMWLGFMKGMAEGVEKAEKELAADLPVEPVKKPKKEKAAKPEETHSKDALRVVVDNGDKAKRARPAARPKVESGAGVDDLKLISGIGPKLESILIARGYSTFAAIASMSAKAAADLDRELGLDGRIERDDWVGQAKALMGEAG